MFIIKRSRGKIPAELSKKFKSYEVARSAVRKHLRTKPHLITPIDKGWNFYNNPSIGDYGFSIVRV